MEHAKRLGVHDLSPLFPLPRLVGEAAPRPAARHAPATNDFDGDKSLKQTGNGKYMMQPVIAIMSVTGGTGQ